MLQTILYLFWEEIRLWLIFWYKEWPKSFFRLLTDFFLNLDHEFSFRAHLRNFFVPLYGQKDIVSLLISIVYRIFILFFGCLASLFLAVIWFLILFIWLILPAAPLILAFIKK